MQVRTSYEHEINRCGDYETNYTLYDFNNVSDEDLRDALAKFFDHADGDTISDFHKDSFPDDYGDPDYSYEWDAEEKRWV